MSTYTLPGSAGSAGNIGTCIPTGTFTVANTGPYTFAPVTTGAIYGLTTGGIGSTSTGLQVSGDTNIKGNLTVNGVNLNDMLCKIQDRLAILVPDPARLEKFEALKLAYEHYLVMEALCINADTTER